MKNSRRSYLRTIFKSVLFMAVFLVIFFLSPFDIKADSSHENDRGPLTKIRLIHYRKNFDRSTNPAKLPKGISCYGYLSKGTFWKKLPVTLTVNTTNTNGLDKNFILSTIEKSVDVWDIEIIPTFYNQVLVDDSAEVDNTSPDYKNEFVFGNYSDPNVIAISTIWGYFGGPIQGREIVEFDVLFNNYFSWGDATKNSALMDFQNISTHEVGHGFGMGDIYDNSCSLVTMFGYSTEGEVYKRTLETADITGIKKLYN